MATTPLKISHGSTGGVGVPAAAGVYFVSNVSETPFMSGSVKTEEFVNGDPPSAYVLRSRTPKYNRTGPRMVKVGQSANLSKRISNYLLYWPNGAVIYGMISCNIDAACPRFTEFFKEHVHENGSNKSFAEQCNAKLAHMLEALWQNHFKHLNLRYRTSRQTSHSHYREWFITNPQDLNQHLRMFVETPAKHILKVVDTLLSCYTSIPKALETLHKLASLCNSDEFFKTALTVKNYVSGTSYGRLYKNMNYSKHINDRGQVKKARKDSSLCKVAARPSYQPVFLYHLLNPTRRSGRIQKLFQTPTRKS